MVQKPRLVPVRCFLTVCIAAVILYLVLGALLWATNRQAKDFRDHALRLDGAVEDARRHAESMADQALLAAATGEQVFAVRRESLGAALARDMAMLRRHHVNDSHVPEYPQLAELVARLEAVQVRAMALATAQELTPAWKLLRGLDYETDLRRLFEALDALDARLDAWAETTLATQTRYNLAALWCLAGFTPIFLVASVVLARSAARHIRENLAAREALAESARTLEALLDATSDRVILADPQGRFLAVNAAAAKGLGLTPSILLGKTFADVFPPDVAAGRLGAVHEALARGRPLRFSDERAGIVFDHIIAPLPDAAGRPRGAALFARDITDIVRAREAAETANRAKSEFLANVGHEVRTPLNGILGMAQILAGTNPTEAQRQCLEDILHASEGLLGLMTNILELSRLETGLEKPEAMVFALSSVLQGLEAAHGPQARDKGLEFRTVLAPDVPPLLVGDGDRLRRALDHLTANAVKFTPAGSVTISVRRHLEAGPAAGDGGVRLDFAVRDTGIGIAVENQARVFESFVQADGSATRRFGGSGLGLAIASRLVESLGGVIRIESGLGRGSVFAFRLRFDEPDPETTGEA